MGERNTAANSSYRREENTPNSTSNPNPESRPFGVVAGRQDSADNLNGLQPLALSVADSAWFLGVEKKTIEGLIKTRRLPFVQFGTQRGRSILVEDLRDFAQKNRVSLDEKPNQ